MSFKKRELMGGTGFESEKPKNLSSIEKNVENSVENGRLDGFLQATGLNELRIRLADTTHDAISDFNLCLSGLFR